MQKILTRSTKGENKPASAYRPEEGPNPIFMRWSLRKQLAQTTYLHRTRQANDTFAQAAARIYQTRKEAIDIANVFPNAVEGYQQAINTNYTQATQHWEQTTYAAQVQYLKAIEEADLAYRFDTTLAKFMFDGQDSAESEKISKWGYTLKTDL